MMGLGHLNVTLIPLHLRYNLKVCFGSTGPDLSG